MQCQTKCRIGKYLSAVVWIVMTVAATTAADRSHAASRADAKPGYTTYTNFSQVVQGIGARYPAIARVSDPGSREHPVYTGFFF